MGGQGRSRNEPGSPDRVRATIETQTRAAQLRAAGASYREIGDALSIDHTWARTLVLRALDATQYDNADLMRQQEGERLDRLQRAAWSQATAGDLKAIDTVRRLMERRARLFGLDHSDGIAERQTAIMEQQAHLIASGIGWLLDQLGVGDDPHARGLAATMLRNLGAQEQAALDAPLEGEVVA